MLTTTDTSLTATETAPAINNNSSTEKQLIFNPLHQQRSGELDQQQNAAHHHVNNELAAEKRPRRGSLPPSEGLKDIILLDNDHFLTICDDYVKLYSDTGDLLHKLKLDSTPISLARFGQDRVVIACDSCRLCVVSIDNGSSLSLVKEFETDIQYSSVSQLGNDELICVGLDEAVLHRLVYKPALMEIAEALPLAWFGENI